MSPPYENDAQTSAVPVGNHKSSGLRSRMLKRARPEQTNQCAPNPAPAGGGTNDFIRPTSKGKEEPEADHGRSGYVGGGGGRGTSLWDCMQQSLHTKSVVAIICVEQGETQNNAAESTSVSNPDPSVALLTKIERRRAKTKKLKKLARAREKARGIILHVTTTCLVPPPSSLSISEVVPGTYHHLYVQPLVVLDLNGILCHRIRSHHHNHTPQPCFRPAIGHVANTGIVPRTDLSRFLTMLDSNFTLAVWTSAKRKTAVDLVEMLFPSEIASRLLFVWAQNKCESVPQPNQVRTDGSIDVLYSKSLSKVWHHFPLWNASNTILMDDSPDKCPKKYLQNTLHPPPILGGSLSLPNNENISNDNVRSNEANRISDETNEATQALFFDKLAQHWKHDDTENNNNMKEAPKTDVESLNIFLNQNAQGHMGWRGSYQLKHEAV